MKKRFAPFIVFVAVFVVVCAALVSSFTTGTVFGFGMRHPAAEVTALGVSFVSLLFGLAVWVIAERRDRSRHL